MSTTYELNGRMSTTYELNGRMSTTYELNGRMSTTYELNGRMSTTYELKPCPFCGAEAFVRSRMKNYWVSAYHDRSCVLCDEKFGFPPIVFGSEAGAVKAWNRRAKS